MNYSAIFKYYTKIALIVLPENLLTGAYTHLNYAFAFIDPSSFAVAPMSDLDKDLYSRFTGLKQVSPGLETWVSNHVEFHFSKVLT